MVGDPRQPEIVWPKKCCCPLSPGLERLKNGFCNELLCRSPLSGVNHSTNQHPAHCPRSDKQGRHRGTPPNESKRAATPRLRERTRRSRKKTHCRVCRHQYRELLRECTHPERADWWTPRGEVAKVCESLLGGTDMLVVGTPFIASLCACVRLCVFACDVSVTSSPDTHLHTCLDNSILYYIIPGIVIMFAIMFDIRQRAA